MYNCAVSNPQMNGFHTFKTFAGVLAKVRVLVS